jgi:hypothetical protein
VTLPPVKVTASTVATWAGIGSSMVSESTGSSTPKSGTPESTSRMTGPPATAGSGVSVAVTAIDTVPMSPQSALSVVVRLSAAADCVRPATRLTVTSTATSRTASDRRPSTRCERLMRVPFLRHAGRVRPARMRPTGRRADPSCRRS